jgi:hypothetical protein
MSPISGIDIVEDAPVVNNINPVKTPKALPAKNGLKVSRIMQFIEYRIN